jgi:hypothetical protein
MAKINMDMKNMNDETLHMVNLRWWWPISCYKRDGNLAIREMAMLDGTSIGDGDNNCYLTKRQPNKLNFCCKQWQILVICFTDGLCPLRWLDFCEKIN